MHDSDGQDPGIGRHLAHDARDEGAVARVGGKLADQRVRRDRRVPWVPDHLSRLVAGRLRVLAFRADGFLDVVIDLDEAVAVVVRVGVVAAAGFAVTSSHGWARTPVSRTATTGRRPYSFTQSAADLRVGGSSRTATGVRVSPPLNM